MSHARARTPVLTRHEVAISGVRVRVGDVTRAEVALITLRAAA
jgi:hypothetical protein